MEIELVKESELNPNLDLDETFKKNKVFIKENKKDKVNKIIISDSVPDAFKKDAQKNYDEIKKSIFTISKQFLRLGKLFFINYNSGYYKALGFKNMGELAKSFDISRNLISMLMYVYEYYVYKYKMNEEELMKCSYVKLYHLIPFLDLCSTESDRNIILNIARNHMTSIDDIRHIKVVRHTLKTFSDFNKLLMNEKMKQKKEHMKQKRMEVIQYLRVLLSAEKYVNSMSKKYSISGETLKKVYNELLEKVYKYYHTGGD